MGSGYNARRQANGANTKMNERKLNTMGQITFADLLAQETKRDPVAFYARLREQGPLIPLSSPFALGESWIVTTYDDAIAILKDPRFIKDTQKVSPPSEGQDAAEEGASVLQRFLTWRRDMLTVDPPDHTRLRGLVSKAFTPRMIEQLRPRVQQIADELVGAVQAQGRMDLIADFAFPLPITVICEMLGIPPTARPQFRTWTQTIVNAPAGPQMEDKLEALEEFVQYIKLLLADKHAHPGNDLISGLVQAEEQGDTLSETELISTIFLLIVAGHETTVNLIGNGMLALLEHPEQMHLLRADSTLLAGAIEELLRYTAPVSLSSPRWASEDICMHGKIIHKGEMVFVSLIGADTDPQQFPDPIRLDIVRQENQHVAFGKGIHYCLGAPLARMEGQIAIGTLLQRLPNLSMASSLEQLTWTQNPLLRGLVSLPVTF
jgi:cytochrome P450